MFQNCGFYKNGYFQQTVHLTSQVDKLEDGAQD